MRNPEAVARVIREAGSVAVCCHINPDGDTVGSALAMRLALLKMGKKAAVFCDGKVPDNLMFLPGADEIRKPEENGDRTYDLLLAVDISDERRMGKCDSLFAQCARTAQIDHHPTNPEFAGINSVDGGAAATCLLILEQIKALGVLPDRETAMCLYAGISTDTGNFSFSCTSAEVFSAMTELMSCNLPLAEMSRTLFREKPKAQLKLLGKTIESLRFLAGGRLAVMKLRQSDFEECGALEEHSDTMVNYGLDTPGTCMAMLARETSQPGLIKFSLRAVEPWSVDDIAVGFGGGGHAQAAGITLKGDLDTEAARVAEAMEKKLNG